MKLRQYGSTDLFVTPLVFGAWEIGGEPFFRSIPERDAIGVIKRAYDKGFIFFDTAPVYGFGRAEVIMGRALRDIRDEVIISTKCGLRWTDEKIGSIHKNASEVSILEEIDMSLRRLETEYIDLYLVHWPDTDTEALLEETVGALEKIKDQGKIRHYGLSNHSTEQLREAARYGTVSGLQSQYSMLCLDLEKGELPHCRENGIGFQAYSPLHRGILTDKTIEALRESNQAAINWLLKSLNKKEREKIEKIRDIAGGYHVSFATFVLGWTIAQPGVTTAIVGTTKADHVDEAVKATQIEITEEDNKAIRAILEG